LTPRAFTTQHHYDSVQLVFAAMLHNYTESMIHDPPHKHYGMDPVCTVFEHGVNWLQINHYSEIILANAL